MRVYALSVLLAFSTSGFAMESVAVDNSKSDGPPITLHMGAGGGLISNAGVTAYELELGVGLTQNFSMRVRGNVFSMLQDAGPFGSRWAKVLSFGIVPAWSVQKRFVTMSVGPYLGSLDSHFTLGVAGNVLFHFGSGVGLSISPTFFQPVSNMGSLVSVTAGLGLSI